MSEKKVRAKYLRRRKKSREGRKEARVGEVIHKGITKVHCPSQMSRQKDRSIRRKNRKGERKEGKNGGGEKTNFKGRRDKRGGKKTILCTGSTV